MEEISIREAGRRLGISDTAINKERKKGESGRVCISRFDAKGRPFVNWEETKRRYFEMTDFSKRAFAGPVNSAKRKNEKPMVELPLKKDVESDVGKDPEIEAVVFDPKKNIPMQNPSSSASYARSRAEKELYNAKKAKLEYDVQAGEFISIDEFKMALATLRNVISDTILQIPNTVNIEGIEKINLENICKASVKIIESSELLSKKDFGSSGTDAGKVIKIKNSASMSLAYRKSLAQTLKEELSAEREKMQLLIEKKKLVNAEEIEDEISSLIAIVRDTLLAMPNHFKVTFQEAKDDQVKWIEQSVLNSLNAFEKEEHDD